MKFMLAVILLSGGLVSCSEGENYSGKAPTTNMTTFFIDNYTGEYRNQNTNETFQFDNSQSFALLIRRNVTHELTTLPNPTFCSYRTRGFILQVWIRSESERNALKPYAINSIVGRNTEIELSDDLEPGSTTNVNCMTYLNQRRAELPRVFEILGEILDGKSIRLHTEGGENYDPTKPRPADTLDEVFTR